MASKDSYRYIDRTKVLEAEAVLKRVEQRIEERAQEIRLRETQQRATKAREDAIREKEVTMTDNRGTFLYLAVEDQSFSRGWGLTEEEFIKLFGSLAEYKLFELQRKEARALGYDIPALPPSMGVEQLKSMRGLGLTEKQVAPILLKDHQQQVAGVQSAIEMDRKMGGPWLLLGGS